MKKVSILICFLLTIILWGMFSFIIKNNNLNVYALSQSEDISFDEFSNNVLNMFEYDKIDSQVADFSVRDNLDNNEIKRFNRLIVKSFSRLDNCGAIAESGMFNGFQIFQYSSKESTENAFNYFSGLDCVEFVEYDYEFEICSVSKSKTEKTYVNDYYDDIGADYFNNFLINEVGLDNLNDVVVAVLDTGIDTDHEFFTDRIADGGKNFISTVEEGYEYEDDEGHGTHVSGTITDLTFDNVKILPIKVGNSEGKVINSAVLLGLNYVINLVEDQNEPICAVNMSLGGYGLWGVGTYDYAEEDLIEQLYKLNVLSVCAAMNENRDVADGSPANIEKAITVSAVYNTTGTWQKAGFSNWGDEIDIAAPGVNINSAKMGGGTIEKNGTSMATPHVAAAVALINSYNNTYSALDIENILKSTCVDAGDEGFDIYFGYGVLNLERANAEFMDEVTYSKESSTCSEPFNLVLSCEGANKIVYTLDGTTPSLTNGIVYSAPIYIDKSTRVRATAYHIENDIVTKFTKINSAKYFFNDDNVESFLTITEDGCITEYFGLWENLIIPETINGIVPKTIGENVFKDNLDLISIVLPSSINKIESHAFSRCSNLKSINLTNIETIYDYAFNRCISLENVDLTNCQTFGDYSFQGCESLISASLYSEEYWGYNGEGIFKDCINLQEVNILGEKDFIESDYMFDGCISLQTINIPYALRIDGYCTFANCENLININAPKLVSIYNGVFYNCSNLSSFNFNPMINISSFFNDETIGAFENCSSLPNKIYLPNITEIGVNTFVGSSVNELVVGNSFEIGKENGITNATIYGYNKEAETFAGICDNTIFVKINSLQILEDLPGKKSILINEPSTLSIQTEGFDQTYEWYVCDNAGLNNPQLIEGQTTNVLTITTTSVCTKYYYVKVINWDGSILISNKCEVKSLINYSTYKIEVTFSEGGQVTPGTEESIHTGETRIYRIYTNEDYYVSSISIDDQYYSSYDQSSIINEFIENGIIFENISENHRINVYFQHNPINITIGDYSNGYVVIHFEDYWELPEEYWDAVQVEGADINEILKDYKDIEKYYQQSITFKITPKEGYYIKNLIINGENIVLADMSTYTFESLEEDSSISAVFESLDAVSYSASHYKETLDANYDIENNGKYYVLYKIETLTGVQNSTTNVVGETINGYTTQNITQQQIELYSDINIEVFYDLNTYSVLINDVIGVNSSGQGNYKYTQTVTIRADVLYGYNWSKWQCGLEEFNNIEYSFTMPYEDLVFTPIVVPNVYNINVTKIGNGIVTPGDCSVNYGENKLFTFIPEENNEVDYVEIDGENIGNVSSYLFSDVTNNHEIKVYFKEIIIEAYEIILDYEDSHGKIECSKSLSNLTSLDSRILTITPKVGYKIKDVQINEVSVGAITIYTFENITSDQTISVEFEIQKFTITFDTRGGTLISGNLSQTINYGANASAPLLTRDGYTQDGWDKPLTNIMADITISAKWNPITYFITYNLMGGTNHLNNPTNYTIESDTTVLQNPTYEGYNFDGWYYNSNFSGDRIYTINQGSIGDLNLHAKFIAIECSVVFNLDSSRFGNISCIDGDLDNIEYGDSLTFEVTPDTGYEVDKVYVNDIETFVTDKKFTISNIKENTNIRVTYKESSSIVTPPNEDSPDMPNDSSGLDDNTKYIIYAGIGLIVLLLSVLIIILSKNNKNNNKIQEMNSRENLQNSSQSSYNNSQIKDMKVKQLMQNRTKISHKSHQDVDKFKNDQQSEQMLQKAFEFVKGKEQNFILFCNKYNIDYQNNYNKAIIKYYQVYLRSLKK